MECSHSTILKGVYDANFPGTYRAHAEPPGAGPRAAGPGRQRRSPACTSAASTSCARRWGSIAPGTPVKVVEPYQMLGEIDARSDRRAGRRRRRPGRHQDHVRLREQGLEAVDPLRRHAGAGARGVQHRAGAERRHPHVSRGRPVRRRPAAACPQGGFYFDTIVRQEPIDDDEPRRRGQPGGVRPDLRRRPGALRPARPSGSTTETDRAILANFGGTAFGDIALVPAPWLKHPKGIRDVEEWYVSTVARRDYVYEVFERQCEIALANLAKIYEAVGDRVTAVFVTGTDFGTQNGPVHLAPRPTASSTSRSTAG